MRSDTGGEFWGMITGAIFGAIAGGVNAFINGENVWAGIGAGAVSGAISGLAVDFAIATGGVGGVVIAAIGGAASSVSDDLITAAANDQEISSEELLVNATVSAVFNMASFGLATSPYMSKGFTLRSKIKAMRTNFSISAFGYSRTTYPLENLAKNFMKAMADSSAIDIGVKGNSLFWGDLIDG